MDLTDGCNHDPAAGKPICATASCACCTTRASSTIPRASSAHPPSPPASASHSNERQHPRSMRAAMSTNVVNDHEGAHLARALPGDGRGRGAARRREAERSGALWSCSERVRRSGAVGIGRHTGRTKSCARPVRRLHRGTAARRCVAGRSGRLRPLAEARPQRRADRERNGTLHRLARRGDDRSRPFCGC